MPRDTKTKGVTRDKLLSDAPFSEAEFDRGLREICGFETCAVDDDISNGTLWVPSAPLLRITWTAFMAMLAIRGDDLSKPIRTREPFEAFVDTDRSGGLFIAVIDRLGNRSGDHTCVTDGKFIGSALNRGFANGVQWVKPQLIRGNVCPGWETCYWKHMGLRAFWCRS